MSVVKVMISDRQKEVKIPTGIRLLIRRSCHAVLELEGFDKPCEVSVSFIEKEEIRKLNLEYREKDDVTDVLSFPNSDNGEYDLNNDTGCYMLGDVVICVARAMEQAEQFGHSLRREISYLTVHSMLHLLGYDHETGGLDQVRMREKEEAVLTRLGLPQGASYVLEDE